MVKGNWERRAELAHLRREEAKIKKSAKSIKNTPINAIILYLQKTLSVTDTVLTIWLRKEAIGCSHWLRLGACENRKCRLLHEPLSDKLSKLEELPEFSEELHCGKDYACEEPMQFSPWEIINESFLERIQYMSLNRKLIFDHITPTVWNNFKNRSVNNPNSENNSKKGVAIATTSTIDTLQTLKKIEESVEDDELEDSQNDKEDITVTNLTRKIPDDMNISNEMSFGGKPRLLMIAFHLSYIVSFLDYSDLIKLFSTSK